MEKSTVVGHKKGSEIADNLSVLEWARHVCVCVIEVGAACHANSKVSCQIFFNVPCE